MVVRPSGSFHGSIGGGELEWRALAEARAALDVGRGAALRRVVALGPELGQCCGGRVEWRIEIFDARDLEALAPLAAAERAGAFAVVARNAADGRVERCSRTARQRRRSPRAPGAKASATTRARSTSSAPAMSGARSCWRWRRCRSRCAGSTRAPTPFPSARRANAKLVHAERAAERARRRARRRAHRR